MSCTNTGNLTLPTGYARIGNHARLIIPPSLLMRMVHIILSLLFVWSKTLRLRKDRQSFQTHAGAIIPDPRRGHHSRPTLGPSFQTHAGAIIPDPRRGHHSRPTLGPSFQTHTGAIIPDPHWGHHSRPTQGPSFQLPPTHIHLPPPLPPLAPCVIMLHLSCSRNSGILVGSRNVCFVGLILSSSLTLWALILSGHFSIAMVGK